jgi:hypothetical protein
MRAEIKHILMPDEPDQPFTQVLMEMLVGTVGMEGEESFQVTVCSPLWLRQQLDEAQVVRPRHVVFMAQFDEAVARRYLTDLVASVVGDSWGEIADQLRSLGLWEFEGYRESP